jgi:hypothetical protein
MAAITAIPQEPDVLRSSSLASWLSEGPPTCACNAFTSVGPPTRSAGAAKEDRFRAGKQATALLAVGLMRAR